MRQSLAAVVMLLLLVASSARAQEPALEETLAAADLPREVEEHLLELFRRPATTRIDAPAELPADSAITGDVAVLGGPFVLAGRIGGELAVVGGDLVIDSTAVVGGDITVVGGEVRGLGTGAIGGTLTAYAGAARGEEADDDEEDDDIRITIDVEADAEEDDADEGASASFMLRFGRSYNRVEGLPIRIGPTLRFGGSNPTRLEAFAIVRTESEDPFDSDELGYVVRLEQFLGGREAWRVGADLHSTVRPIERWKLSDTENSLSTLIFHDDRRDYFERTGWRAYVRWTPPDRALEATLAYRDDEYGIEPADDPWALFGDEPWRPQPIVAAGELRSLVAEAELDTRDDGDGPASGWFLRARLRQGLGGSLERPAPPDGIVPLAGDAPMDIVDAADLTTGFLDLRRYQRVDRDAIIALRLVAGGSLFEDALPPQFQHTLGGLGTLPGYDLFAADCGARAVTLPLPRRGETEPFFPYYGCDRFTLFQAEYRGTLDFELEFGPPEEDDRGDEEERDDDWDLEFDLEPGWVVFFDAGRGWALGGRDFFNRTTDTDWLYDVGLGFLLGDLGIYAALPLTGEADGVNLFVRLGPRF